MKNAKLNGDWPDPIITVPAIHHFDDDARIVIMDGCCVGSLTLERLMLPSLSMGDAIVGKVRGEFLGQ